MFSVLTKDLNIVMLLFCIGLHTISAVIFADTSRVLQDGSEKSVESKLSPTAVIRKIATQAIKWKIEYVDIITEPRFDNIVREWCRELTRPNYTSAKVLNSHKAAEEIAFPSNLRKTPIVLLTPRALADLFSNQKVRKLLQYQMGTGGNRIIIVGRCLPSFIRRYKVLENLRMMIYSVRTDHWINGVAMAENLTFHSIHRQSKNTWRTFPIMSPLSPKLTRRNSNRSLYGILQNILIYADIFPREDLHIGIFAIYLTNAYTYLPPLYYDGLTLHGMKIYHPFLFDDLFAILKHDVWIILLLVIFICNFCYYLAHDNSPSLRHHPRIKNNSFGKFWRIMSLDSLIRFHMEWQQGPNLSTRWLNTTLSFLSFMSACYYLPLFTMKLLSDRYFFPFTDDFDSCKNYNASNVFLSRDVVSFSLFLGCLDAPGVECIDALYNYSINAVDLLEKTKHGDVYLIAGGIYGRNKFQHFPNISNLKTPACHKPVSIEILRDFIFLDIFSHILLQIREAGLLQALHIRYMTSYPANIQIPKTMTFLETWFTFAILGIGLSMAVFILVIERFAKQ